MKFFKALAVATSFVAVSATGALANCDPGEEVIKFSHVTNTDKHPKGIAATLLADRVNKEMNGKACMEVFPNSSLYDDNKVLEASVVGRCATGGSVVVEVREIHQEIPPVRPAVPV